MAGGLAYEVHGSMQDKWGEHGRRIKDIRATVERFPYYDEQRNQAIDVSVLARGATG